MNKELLTKLGSAMYETHGALCQELIDAGYDLDNYYNGADRWGDFNRVIVKVAQARGAGSYDEYLRLFETIKQEGDQVVSKQLFARLTGIYTPRTNTTQTDRTRRYRANQSSELAELRALRWIDDNTVDAIAYIRDKYPNLL